LALLRQMEAAAENLAGSHGSFALASEMQSLSEDCRRFQRKPFVLSPFSIFFSRECGHFCGVTGQSS